MKTAMNQHNDSTRPDPDAGQNAPEPESKAPGLKEIVGSVFSAALGVQSRKNRERDFKHGRARNFIIAGIVFTVLFIATVFTVVNIVLKQAGH
jgi:hypothetical protein